ncbi:aromatic amino acid aminotransferas-like protein [Tothia fuscella]|uniref:Aromatic amino acid aminotransferas-like protein n=1 Tax=Tothia fuscella TaxID=1048955 RepID=A0A9P4TWR9_9PEZI|nr:aromatic amino acid aminotransferas-like protein [Tothia fuscella]
MSTMDNMQKELPEPKDLSHHLSRTTRNRQASSIKQFYKYFSIPGIGQLAGGLPNNNYFPFDDLEARTALPDRWNPTPNIPIDPPSGKSKDKSKDKSKGPPESHTVVPKAANTTDVLKRIDLASALQYGTAQGYPPLYQFLRQFTTQNLHPHIPYKDGAEIILTCGSTDGFSKCIQALNNEWSEGRDPIEEKEGLLCEDYAYMNALQTANPRGMNIAPVGMDDEGMRAEGPGGLNDVLSNWNYAKGKLPHLMYTVTIGQNPTSGTLSVQRRKEIYALCAKYDVIIIEDDPYWYLQYPSSKSSVPIPQKSSGFAFLDSLVPSYLSIDYEGRVLRLDTFSKTVAPGCRLGWITGQPALIERILRITECSTQQPSGFVQSMIAELIMGPAKGDKSGSGGAKDGHGWDVEGWVRWLEGLRGEYQRRMEDMCDILDRGKTLVKSGRRKSLSGLAGNLSLEASPAATEALANEDDWSVIETAKIYDFIRPLGGMFIWVRFDFTSHPLASKVLAPRLSRALWIFWTFPQYRVLVSPGGIFGASDAIREQDAHNCFRLCFAACPRDDLKDISTRFVKGVQNFWRFKKVSDIDELLKDEDDGTAAGLDATAGMGALIGFC